MNPKTPQRKRRKDTRNIFKYLFFGWLNELFDRGYKEGIQENDLLELEQDETSYNLCGNLERHWRAELNKKKTVGKRPSLMRAVCKTFGRQYSLYSIFAVLKEVMIFTNPFLMFGFLKYFENESSLTEAYLYAAAMTVATFTVGVCNEWYYYFTTNMGWQLRTAVCALMYKKAIRLDQRSLGKTTTGQIISLGATDVIRFDYVTIFLNHVWIAPLVLIVVAVLVWQMFDVSALLAIGFVLLNMTISTLLGRFYGKIRRDTSLRTDKRVRMMNEIVSAMRVVKMFAWEKPYEKLVKMLRKKEISQILSSSYLRAFSYSLNYVTNKFAIFGTLVLYVALGGHLTAPKVFSFIAWVNATRIPVGMLFCWAVDYGSETIVSIRRIESFLLLDEMTQTGATSSAETECDKRDVTETQRAPKIVFENFTATWNDANPSYVAHEDEACQVTLKGIDVSVNNNMLLAVIGPVGSGKSSLLSSILRELPASSGRVEVCGQVTYAGQIPWVFSGTIRENILFGEKYEPERLKNVIDACALREDINKFDQGEDTVVGERGAPLSGGQKARVNLARAAYKRNTDIILMDDPLSAVDGNVAHQLFNQCICGYMANKLRVLVTHQLPILKTADRILVLEEGEISKSGSYEELLADGTDFVALLTHEENDEAKPSQAQVRERCRKASGKHGAIVGIEDTLQDQTDYVATVEEEAKEEGNIGWKSFVEYVVNNKYAFTLLVIISLSNQTLFVVFDWWIAIWTAESEEFAISFANMTFAENATSSLIPTSLQTPTEFNNYYYIYIAAYLLLAFVVTMFTQTTLGIHHLVMSGMRMHDKMFAAVLRSPTRFFDTNPIGRVLNRFAKDLGQVDEVLPRFCAYFVFDVGVLLSVMILSSVLNYFVLIPTLPLLLYFLWLRRYYISTSCGVKRLEGRNRSPVFSHMKSTLNGLATVRAFGMQNEFETVFHRLQDGHSRAWSVFVAGTRWLAIRLDVIGAAYVGAVAFLAVITTSQTHLNAGQVGLAITYVMEMFARLQYCVRLSTDIENQMTSVERIRQYYKLPSEAPHYIPKIDANLPKPWPSHGQIELVDVSFAHYKGGPNVLKNISAKISAHEKIGIVGRTGAGKSSLISCLFRFNELTSGKLVIDDVDVSQIGLNALRSSISAIPQDPILFASSLRYNLDPFGVFSDSDIWNALREVQMEKEISSNPLKLEMELSESGSNFSVGQCQLICLARAMLEKNKILVVDEATANVDVRTDQLIQKTIRETFKECTVITVAHRIDTIIDCDRVMVLHQGKVVDFDEPHRLLQRDGVFSRMVNAIGVSESRTLRKAAEKAFILRERI